MINERKREKYQKKKKDKKEDHAISRRSPNWPLPIIRIERNIGIWVFVHLRNSICWIHVLVCRHPDILTANNVWMEQTSHG